MAVPVSHENRTQMACRFTGRIGGSRNLWFISHFLILLAQSVIGPDQRLPVVPQLLIEFEQLFLD
jgi:hypothetical protein